MRVQWLKAGRGFIKLHVFHLLPHQPVRKTHATFKLLGGNVWAANYVGLDVLGIPGLDNLRRLDFGPARDFRRVTRITIASTPDNGDEPPAGWG